MEKAVVKVLLRLYSHIQPLAVAAYPVKIIAGVIEIFPLISVPAGPRHIIAFLQAHLPGLYSRMVCQKISIFPVAVRPLGRDGIHSGFIDPGPLSQKKNGGNKHKPHYGHSHPVPLALSAFAQDQVQHRPRQHHINHNQPFQQGKVHPRVSVVYKGQQPLPRAVHAGIPIVGLVTAGLSHQFLIHALHSIIPQLSKLLIPQRAEIDCRRPVSDGLVNSRVLGTLIFVPFQAVTQLGYRHLPKINFRLHIAVIISVSVGIFGGHVLLSGLPHAQILHLQKILRKAGKGLFPVCAGSQDQPAAVIHPFLNRQDILTAKGGYIKLINDQEIQPLQISPQAVSIQSDQVQGV